MAGIKGEWVEADKKRIVKHIRYCPNTGKLKGAPDFCERLGTKIMANVGIKTYDKNSRAVQITPKTIARG